MTVLAPEQSASTAAAESASGAPAPVSPMRVMLLTRSLNYGGAERQLVALARGLAERGHSVDVAVCYSGGPLQGELEAAGVPVHDLAKRHRWDVFGFLRRLVRTVRGAKPDVVHGYLVFPNLLTVFLRPFVGAAEVVWGVRASNMDFRRYDALSRFTFTAGCILSRYADLIVANSKAGAAFHQDHGYPQARMVTIPNGIDTERFAIDRAAGVRQREAWGLDASHTVIGLVGRLDPMKDHTTFLAAAKRLAAGHPERRFVLVGDGPQAYRQELVALVDRLELSEQVLWAGSQHDMRAVFNAFDIAVSSSAFGEGFPNVVGEALACGVPTVATHVGDATLVVGDAGRVVAPGDAPALAVAVQATLDDPVEPEQLRRRIRDEFSVPRLIERTEAVLARSVRAETAGSRSAGETA